VYATKVFLIAHNYVQQWVVLLCTVCSRKKVFSNGVVTAKMESVLVVYFSCAKCLDLVLNSISVALISKFA
jgi:hypothetical protein